MFDLFWQSYNYWVRIVIWEFGAWKTLSTMAYMLKQKQRYKDNIIIFSNILLDFVDFPFNSISDLRFIFELLINYINKTNKKEFLPTERQILLVIDELHLYFPSSSWWSFIKFSKEDLILLTQCRKRNIEIIWITQELWQISKRFRVLSPYVRKYYKGLGFYRWYKDFYLKTLDSTDLLNPEVADIVGGWFLRGWWFPWRWYSEFPKRLSYFVVGSQDFLTPKKKLEIQRKMFIL